jgi:hypothetical protein
MAIDLKLNRAYIMALQELYDHGGSAKLDAQGSLRIPPDNRALTGHPVSWLVLVAQGYLAGEDGRLIISELGREAVKAYRQGRTRVAV